MEKKKKKKDHRSQFSPRLRIEETFEENGRSGKVDKSNCRRTEGGGVGVFRMAPGPLVSPCLVPGRLRFDVDALHFDACLTYGSSSVESKSDSDSISSSSIQMQRKNEKKQNTTTNTHENTETHTHTHTHTERE